MTLAQQIAHPFSLGFALNWAAVFHQFRREVRAAQERAEAAISLAREQGFPLWMAIGFYPTRLGTCTARTGAGRDRADHPRLESLSCHRSRDYARPYFLALLAEAHGTLGKPEAGLTVLAEALTLVDNNGERWYEAELHRLKGALLLQQSSDNQAEAETCFQHAIDIAQNQHAKSFELRTTTSLARLWQQQGKRQEAHDLLAPVYGWFTEGFDTADLKDAKALLDELA